MVKEILLLLGETQASAAAREYAFQLARQTDAEIAGLSGIYLSEIESSVPGGIGASAYRLAMESQLRKKAEELRQNLHDEYERECRSRGIRFEWLSFEGDPLSTLHLAVEPRDLVVTGHDTTFAGGEPSALSVPLARLLAATPRPVVVCGAADVPGGDVMVAYDGSVAAMRAVQIFALMRLGDGRRILVTAIDPDRELAARKAAGAVAYLHVHGYDAVSNPVVTDVGAADVLRIEVAGRGIGTVVMGAYGNQGLREVLFGSTTRNLVENPPCALLLYH